MARAAVTPSSLLGGGRAGRGRSGRLIGSAGWAGPTAPACQPRDLLPPHHPPSAQSGDLGPPLPAGVGAGDASSQWKGLGGGTWMPRCKARLVQEYVYLLPQPGYCALAFLLSLFKIFKKMCYECFPCILCVCAPCPQGPEEVVGYSETDVTNVCEPLVGSGNRTLGVYKSSKRS